MASNRPQRALQRSLNSSAAKLFVQQRTTQPRRFYQFSDLPLELRISIWGFAYSPQTISIGQKSHYGLDLLDEEIWRHDIKNIKVPSILHTCRESRQLALKDYLVVEIDDRVVLELPKGLSARKKRPTFYVNLTHDTFHLQTDCLNLFRVFDSLRFDKVTMKMIAERKGHEDIEPDVYKNIKHLTIDLSDRVPFLRGLEAMISLQQLKIYTPPICKSKRQIEGRLPRRNLPWGSLVKGTQRKVGLNDGVILEFISSKLLSGGYDHFQHVLQWMMKEKVRPDNMDDILLNYELQSGTCKRRCMS